MRRRREDRGGEREEDKERGRRIGEEGGRGLQEKEKLLKGRCHKYHHGDYKLAKGKR